MSSVGRLSVCPSLKTRLYLDRLSADNFPMSTRAARRVPGMPAGMDAVIVPAPEVVVPPAIAPPPTCAPLFPAAAANPGAAAAAWLFVAMVCVAMFAKPNKKLKPIKEERRRKDKEDESDTCVCEHNTILTQVVE